MKRNYFKTAWRLSIGVTILVVLLIFVFNGFDFRIFTNFKTIAIGFVYSVTLTFVNYFFFKLLGQKYDWESHAKKRMVFGFLGSIVLTIVAYGFCRFVRLVWIEHQETAKQFFATEKVENYFFPFLITVIVSLFMHAFYFYKTLQENKVKEQKIIAGTASAKFDALKNQLDPHFLFNSLNVLTALIDENPEAAQNFTASLSKVYRYVLEQKTKELVPVVEEIAFVETYLNLLKMRFEGSIRCELPTRFSNPEAKIVPLSLQLLLENAVKHNSFSEENPLLISIEEDNGFLVVKNNTQLKTVFKSSSGVGLQNIRQRYQILSSRKVNIKKSPSVFEVRLPLLTQKMTLAEARQAGQDEHERERKLAQATEHVKQQRGFYGNLTAFLIVMPSLFLLNLLADGLQPPWFIFPLLGWGGGLVYHYMDVFDKDFLWGKAWQQRKIAGMMPKIAAELKTEEVKPTEQQCLQEAKKRVKTLKQFYAYLVLYVVVIGILAAINFKGGLDAYPWFLWVAGGWGIAVAFQATKVFRWNPFFNKAWEERKIKSYLEKENLDRKQHWK